MDDIICHTIATNEEAGSSTSSDLVKNYYHYYAYQSLPQLAKGRIRDSPVARASVTRLTHDEVPLATAVWTDVKATPGKAVVHEHLSRVRDDLSHQTVHSIVGSVLKDEGKGATAVCCGGGGGG